MFILKPVEFLVNIKVMFFITRKQTNKKKTQKCGFNAYNIYIYLMNLTKVIQQKCYRFLHILDTSCRGFWNSQMAEVALLAS